MRLSHHTYIVGDEIIGCPDTYHYGELLSHLGTPYLLQNTQHEI